MHTCIHTLYTHTYMHIHTYMIVWMSSWTRHGSQGILSVMFWKYRSWPGCLLSARLIFWLLYSWLIWRVLKLAFFFQKRIFPVFILASRAVRTTPSLCRHIFMRSLIWRWWAFAKKRQIKNHAKLTSYTVLYFTHYTTSPWLTRPCSPEWIISMGMITYTVSIFCQLCQAYQSGMLLL